MCLHLVHIWGWSSVSVLLPDDLPRREGEAEKGEKTYRLKWKWIWQNSQTGTSINTRYIKSYSAHNIQEGSPQEQEEKQGKEKPN